MSLFLKPSLLQIIAGFAFRVLFCTFFSLAFNLEFYKVTRLQQIKH